MKPPTSLQKWRAKIKRRRKEADRLFQEAVIKKHKQCEICGSKNRLVAHHYIAKSLSNATRYYIPNGVCCCFSCHQIWHSTADPRFQHKILNKRGAEWDELLNFMRKQPVKLSLGFYEENIKRLKLNLYD